MLVSAGLEMSGSRGAVAGSGTVRSCCNFWFSSGVLDELEVAAFDAFPLIGKHFRAMGHQQRDSGCETGQWEL